MPIFLSELEVKMLTSLPGSLNERQKRNINYRIKTKIAQLEELMQEIWRLIEYAPLDQLAPIASNDTIFYAFGITERLFYARNPLPMVDSDKPYVKLVNIVRFPKNTGCVEFTRDALPEEINLYEDAKTHIKTLESIYSPYRDTKIYSQPEYEKMISIHRTTAMEEGIKCTHVAQPGLIPLEMLSKFPKDHPIHEEFKGKDMRSKEPPK